MGATRWPSGARMTAARPEASGFWKVAEEDSHWDGLGRTAPFLADPAWDGRQIRNVADDTSNAAGSLRISNDLGASLEPAPDPVSDCRSDSDPGPYVVWHRTTCPNREGRVGRICRPVPDEDPTPALGGREENCRGRTCSNYLSKSLKINLFDFGAGQTHQQPARPFCYQRHSLRTASTSTPGTKSPKGRPY